MSDKLKLYDLSDEFVLKTKKDLLKTAAMQSEEVSDEDLMNVFVIAHKMVTYFKELQDNLKSRVCDLEDFENAFNAVVTIKKGREFPDYMKDDEYARLYQELANRKIELDNARKLKEKKFFDQDAAEIPVVGLKSISPNYPDVKY